MSRVAITGIGIVAPSALGVEAFRALLNAGTSTITRVERFDTEGLSAHNAALVIDFKARDYIPAMKLRRMNTLSRYAVAATRLAIDDAAVSLPNEAGVAVGTAFGPVQTSVDYMQEYVAKGAALAPPQLFAESVANAPGSHIAIEHDLRGFNVTVTQRESSLLAAAMFASAQIVKGTVPSAIIGGVEEVNEMVFSVLDRVGALAHADGDLMEEMRPFDRRRNGMSIGEGSAIFMAEAQPEREPYGWISGFGIARDTTAAISDWGTGDANVALAMQAAIDDAGIALSEVDAIYASANGTKRGDLLEMRALQRLFGDDVPPVVATKAYFGEYAAGGGLQFAAALLAMRDQRLHASSGFEEADTDMRFIPVREARSAKLRNILVHSISAGGGIVCAVISKERA
ncbi:MAG TPA: beta-ketoacyl synthase N-terminal-like domain-containing protein [Thermoanaerobaculia bacterium]|jgi:3-oxoacyl-[acyl-carrier-protein] synthase II|nr:beta-ketoacyl synthase N-terminal-like domain-containing protein [Thermoanaerobaculia bacterium]